MNKAKLRSVRFEIVGDLGSGGSGQVYRAYDRHNDTYVALKTLRTLGARQLLSLKNEFRALADLQHPNLIRLGELHCENDRWFFSMELVDGLDIVRYIRGDDLQHDGETKQPLGTTVTPASLTPATPHTNDLTHLDSVTMNTPMEPPTLTTMMGTRFAPASQAQDDTHALASQPAAQQRSLDPPDQINFYEHRLRRALGQLVQALCYVHDTGRIHRDVKPGNVLVDRQGRVVLLDFGIIGELSSDGAVPESQIRGTPSYMAPEQIQCIDIGPAADWYAVGVLLFKALTGRLPFTGPLNQMLRDKCTRDAPHPRVIRPDLPTSVDDLIELCRHLLQRDPRSRATRASIAQCFGVHPDQPINIGRADSRQRVEALFVGRDDELGQLLTVAASAFSGGHGAALVFGEAGVGKTSLLNRFVDTASVHHAPLTVLRGRCYEQELVPFRGFDAVIDDLSEYLASLPARELEPLLAPGVLTLAKAFPVLLRVPAIAQLCRRSPASAGDDDADRRGRAFAELRALLTALAARNPLLILIDDLQWADRDSLELLSYLLGPTAIRGCAVVCALRGYQDMDPWAVSELRVLSARLTSIMLSRLTPAEAGRLLASIYHSADPVAAGAGGARRGDEAAGWREGLLAEAGGHPMFLSELAYWAISEPEAAERQPIRLEALLQRRIERFADHERRLLWLAALVGVPVPYQILCEVAELHGDDAQSALAALRAAHLITINRYQGYRAIEPYHDRIREAMLADTARHSPEQLAAIHWRIGCGLLDHPGYAQAEKHLFIIARHMNAGAAHGDGAADRQRLAQVNLRAGRHARLATSYQGADQYLQRALGFLSENSWAEAPGLTRELTVELMELDYQLGRIDSGVARFDELLAHSDTVLERAQLHVIRVRLEANQGRLREAIDVGRRGMRLLGVRVPGRANQLSVLREYLMVRGYQRGRSTIELRELKPLSDARVQAVLELLMAITPPAFFVDTDLLITVLLRIVRLSLKHGVEELSVYAFAAYGGVLAGAFRNFQGAYAMGEFAYQLNQRNHTRSFSCKVQFFRGLYIHGWQRPYREAVALLRDAYDLGRKYGDNQYAVYSAGALVVVAVCQGDSLDDLLGHATWSLAFTHSHGEANMSGETDAIIRYIMALRGETIGGDISMSTAAASEVEFVAGLSEQHTPAAIFYYHFYKAQLAYLFGYHDLASFHITASNSRTQPIFGIPLTADHILYNGLIAAKRYRDQPKRRWLRVVRRSLRALRSFARACPQNFEARYWLLAGEQAHIRGEREVALRRYQLAFDTAAQYDAPQHQALAMELTASALRQRGGDDAEAIGHAIAAYQRWGASAKVRQLAPAPVPAHDASEREAAK